LLSCLLTACSGGKESADQDVASGMPECDGHCADSNSYLTIADNEKIIAQAVFEAQARGVAATIAISDRVGNVLAVFRMNGADTQITIDSGRGVSGGLEGIAVIPDSLVAISKAVTAAYLSSEGNAFSTRTASQIVQQHFNPGEDNQVSGPLFGVQFSQLACSDINTRFSGSIDAGPKRSPLGLSADPGGFPLYKNGTVVGGVGVISDGVYGLDLSVFDRDNDQDEVIALAAAHGFAAPTDRRADRITADGRLLRFSDAELSDRLSDPTTANSFASINGVQGQLLAVPGYNTNTVQNGLSIANNVSGIRADNTIFPGLDAFVLVNTADTVRYSPSNGSDGALALQSGEVKTLLATALQLANRTRAQIRRPLSTAARVSISVVDSNGVVLGVVRSRDAPIFGIDVSVQKARSAALFSHADVITRISAATDANYVDSNATATIATVDPNAYLSLLQTFSNDASVIGSGQIAYSARAIGNLARPYYPDGLIGPEWGPLSKRISRYSPFSTGLQFDLVNNATIQHVAFVLGLAPDVANDCTGVTGLTNGLQVFPGGVPIYREQQLVGAIGVSGDGVDQDDMIAFLSIVESGLASLNHAPLNMRADTVSPSGVRLRYVQCPQAPFLDSAIQNVCAGK
jgi:uncharacterized protein GlcG (DUF336 family)